MATEEYPQESIAKLPFEEFAITDDLELLISVLPDRIQDATREAAGSSGEMGELVEIVLDLGRRPEARYAWGASDLSDSEITRDDLQTVTSRIGCFGDDNRAGIERTLHRISAIRNRTGEIVGLTCRVGRAVFGTIAILRDLVESGESILLLGRPGVGKTTMLRETARVLADDLHKRVIVVDTSNEIAGDGDIPHPAIGHARRMQVPTPTAQHSVMIEAVENHMPEVVVIDEIGTELEALAARTIAERGVQLIGTAHGNTLENLMINPTLSELIGGIQSVTLSDEEARRRGTQKSILERKAPPAFEVMVEIVNRDEVVVHRDVAATVDAVLRGSPLSGELRKRLPGGEVAIESAPVSFRDAVRNGTVRSTGQRDRRNRRPTEEPISLPVADPGGTDAWADADRNLFAVEQPTRKQRGTTDKPLRIYPFGVSRNRLESVIQQLRAEAIIVKDLREADVVMTLKNYYRTKPQPIRDAELRGIPVFVLRANTTTQMETALSSILPVSRPARIEPAAVHQEGSSRNSNGVVDALEEAETAINAILGGTPAVTLAPQVKYVRRLQHELADRYNIGSRSTGREPHRRVELFRERYT